MNVWMIVTALVVLIALVNFLIASGDYRKNKAFSLLITTTFYSVLILACFSILIGIKSNYDKTFETHEEKSKEEAAQYYIDVKEYIKGKDLVIINDVTVERLQVNRYGELEFKVTFKDGKEYAEELTSIFEESLDENDEPYIGVIELDDSIQYWDKPERAFKLFIPKGYIKNNN